MSWDDNEARLRGGSCEVTPQFNPSEVLNDINGNEVPADKVKAMQEYAKKLRKQFPHMKEPRIQRKVAEYFKIKLV